MLAIGNAPTALFRLLELIDDGVPAPVSVLGGPVGFVGSAQSKQELIDRPRGMEYLVVRGPPRRQCDGRRRGQCDRERTRMSTSAGSGTLWRRRAGPGRSGTGDGQGRPGDRRGRRRRVSQCAPRPQHRPPHRRAVPAAGSDRGAPGLSGDHRDHRPPRRLRRCDGGLLPRVGRAHRRASRRRARRRAAGRGRSAVLQLLYAHAHPADRAVRRGHHPRRDVGERGVGRHRHSAGDRRRGAHDPARHHAGARAGPPAGRHRRRGGDEAGSHVSAVREALSMSGRLDEAFYVERASTDAQRVLPAADVDDDGVPYFSLAMLPGGQPAQRRPPAASRSWAWDPATSTG